MYAFVAVLAGLVLLGTGSMAVVAQSDDRNVMTGQTAAWVTFEDQECSMEEVVPVQDGLIQRVRVVTAACDVTFSDPRVSGAATVSGNYDCHAEAGCTTWGTQEIAGPDGTWSGPYTGFIDPEFTEYAHAVMAGSAQYEGLIFIVHSIAPFDEPPSVTGLIYEGDRPPVLVSE